MPIIDFPFYLDTASISASINATTLIRGFEEVDGIGYGTGNLYGIISGNVAITSVVSIDGEAFLGGTIPGTITFSPTITPKLPCAASIASVITIEGGVSYGDGRGYLPELISFGSDAEVSAGYAVLPALYAVGDLDLYVPEALTGMYGFLFPLTSVGIMSGVDIGDGTLPAIISSGWLTSHTTDTIFSPPFFLESRIAAVATFSANESIDGFYASTLAAEISAAVSVYPNIAIDGVSYVSANIVGITHVLSIPSVTHKLSGQITSVGTINPSNTIGFLSYWENSGTASGMLQPLYSYAFTGDRLEASFTSVLYGFDADVGYGVYFINYDETLLFTDNYISVLAAAILEATIPTSVLTNATVFSGLGIYSRTVPSGAVTLTSPYAGNRVFTNTFTSQLSGTYSNSALRDVFATFTSSLSAASLFSLYKQIIASFLSTLSLDETLSTVASLQALFSSTAYTRDNYISLFEDVPAPLRSTTATWVVDVDTKASVQYSNFGFNSYAKHGDVYVAAADDGIYLLDGNKDAGENIDAFVDLAVSRFATPQRKYFPSVYLGVTSTGKMLVRAEVDGQTWLYEANNTSANTANQRVDTGRGLVGSYWRFTILNQDGLDFDLEAVEFLPLISSRRVY